MRRKIAAGATVGAITLALFGCAPSSGPADGEVELTLWMAGDCAPGECIEQALVDAFEAENPEITIEVVPNPPDGYFAALQSASIAGRGPDLATMWPGGYMNPFKDFMADAREWVPAELIKESGGTNYFSEGNNSENVVYAIPTTNQWYIGFYNKRIFAENGIDTVPTTWDELNQVSETLAAAGVLPIVNGASGGSAQFQPLFEWAYLAAELPVEEWSKLYNGELPYNNPTLVSQLENWAATYSNGFLNEAAFNDPEVESTFLEGGAAMMLSGGSWQIPALEEAMGDDLGIMTPPYSTGSSRPLVETAGTGYTVLNYSDHQDEAGKFLAFILSDAGQQIIADMGQPVTRPGFTTSSDANNQLAELSASSDTSSYPMFDNFAQPSVTDAIYSNVGLVLVGQLSAEEALSAIDAVFEALPEEEKNVDIPLFSR